MESLKSEIASTCSRGPFFIVFGSLAHSLARPLAHALARSLGGRIRIVAVGCPEVGLEFSFVGVQRSD